MNLGGQKQRLCLFLSFHTCIWKSAHFCYKWWCCERVPFKIWPENHKKTFLMSFVVIYWKHDQWEKRLCCTYIFQWYFKIHERLPKKCTQVGMIWFEKYFLLYTQHGKKSQKINVGEFNLVQKSTRKEKRNFKGTGFKKTFE